MPGTDSASPNGAAPEELSDHDIEEWLLGDDVETDEPLPQHRFQLAMQQVVLASNTRWLSRLNFGTGKDIGDEALMQSARSDARRARAMIERFSKAALEAWPDLSMERRHEMYEGLPKAMRTLIDGLSSSRAGSERT